MANMMSVPLWLGILLRSREMWLWQVSGPLAREYAASVMWHIRRAF